MNNPKVELREYLDKLIHRYLNIKSMNQQLESILEWKTPTRIETLNLGSYFFQLVAYSLERTINVGTLPLPISLLPATFVLRPQSIGLW